MNARRLIIVISVFAVLLTTWGSAYAQSTDVQYFPDTGHTVRGAFLQFYNSAKDPALVYGYPITEQMLSVDGKTVQYFHRARFELVDNQTVSLTPLGTLQYEPGDPLIDNNPSACETFNNVPVCYAFLAFYKAHGGPGQFGNPISTFEVHDGLIVQYFQGARFEWRADRPTNNRVAISDLGTIYFGQIKEDPALRKPIELTGATIDPVLSLKVRAFVAKAITLENGQQTVYITVHSQNARPVSGATGTVRIQLTDGTVQELAFTTNTRGIAQVTFNFANQKAGELVPIEITVNYQTLQAQTKTSFRVWF